MKILLCEDEVELSDGLVAILKRNNYLVEAVYDGQEAIDYLDIQQYDAVILDIMMPLVNGLEVLKHIREKGNKVPVIMLTAKSELEDKVTGLDLGADDYLTKPFATKELLARLRALTRRQTTTLQSDLVFGNVKLNRNSFELSSDNNSYKLSNKEFQMMEMLMGNPEQMYSTDRFMEMVWGNDSEAEINVVWVHVVWVHISALRKKLKNIGANFKIVSARNQGYYLKEIS